MSAGDGRSTSDRVADGMASSDGASRRPSPATYSPSPRPTYDRPTHITAATVTRHVWGDDQAHHVADWIYASTDLIHALVFGLPPGGRFVHSPEHRTVFAADEVLTVLRGRMILANPETGEVQPVEVGESVAFGQDTWHHAFAHGEEELRVLELFAPPPSTGSSGAYSRTRPYLESAKYADDDVLGNWPAGADEHRGRSTLRLIDRRATHHRLAGDALIGVRSSTPRLTVATLSLSPGGVSSVQQRGGDEVLYGCSGVLHVRAWCGGETFVFEVRADEACYFPAGCTFEYRNYTRADATAVLGVAPRYLPAGDT